jgi:chemotaxis family two-component system response regulator Rcp1
MKKSGLDVLCIDDDDCHVKMLRHAAAKDSRPLNLQSVRTGEEGMRYLRVPGQRPDIILLDYDMPGRDGLSVLREIRADQRLKAIPVLMLSSAGEAALIRSAYECGANIFFVKPSTLEQYAELVALFITLWGFLAELPPAEVPESLNIVG